MAILQSLLALLALCQVPLCSGDESTIAGVDLRVKTLYATLGNLVQNLQQTGSSTYWQTVAKKNANLLADELLKDGSREAVATNLAMMETMLGALETAVSQEMNVNEGSATYWQQHSKASASAAVPLAEEVQDVVNQIAGAKAAVAAAAAVAQDTSIGDQTAAEQIDGELSVAESSLNNVIQELQTERLSSGSSAYWGQRAKSGDLSQDGLVLIICALVAGGIMVVAVGLLVVVRYRVGSEAWRHCVGQRPSPQIAAPIAAATAEQ